MPSLSLAFSWYDMHTPDHIISPLQHDFGSIYESSHALCASWSMSRSPTFRFVLPPAHISRGWRVWRSRPDLCRAPTQVYSYLHRAVSSCLANCISSSASAISALSLSARRQTPTMIAKIMTDPLFSNRRKGNPRTWPWFICRCAACRSRG